MPHVKFTPGEILLEDFLKPLNVTRYWLAQSTACSNAESRRSAPAKNGPLPPIPPCVLHGSSVPIPRVE